MRFKAGMFTACCLCANLAAAFVGVAVTFEAPESVESIEGRGRSNPAPTVNPSATSPNLVVGTRSSSISTFSRCKRLDSISNTLPYIRRRIVSCLTPSREATIVGGGKVGPGSRVCCLESLRLGIDLPSSSSSSSPKWP